LPVSPQGVSKTQNGLFPSKSALHLKKVRCKVSLCAVWHSLAYLSVQKYVRGDVSLLRENLAETDQPPSKTPIFNQYLLVAFQPQHSDGNT